MSVSIKDEVKQYKENIWEGILSSFSPEEREASNHDRCSLYCVSLATMERLVAMDKSLESEVGGLYEGVGISKVVKLINPKSVAYKFSFGMKAKYQLITSDSGVEKHIEKQYEISRNTRRKLFIKNLKDSPFGEQEVSLKIREFDTELELDDEVFKDLLLNKDSYEIVITDFIHKRIYPNLFFTTVDGKSHDEYLRVNVPNILLYDKDGGRALFRSDEKIQGVVSEYPSLHDRIYFKKKETNV